MAEIISSFRDLRVYQLALKLQQMIFAATKSFPTEERYSLTDQIRRASRAIGANIAEAWQKRRYPAHFVSKLTDSDGEQAETQHWLESARACGYLTEKNHLEMLTHCQHIGQMLGTMISKPEKFCQNFEARPSVTRPPSSVLSHPSSALTPQPSVLSPRSSVL